VNEATIQFFNPDPKGEVPGKPVAVRLPDGYDTWAAAWERGGTVLWVREKAQKDPKGGTGASIRSYDFSDPARVKETTLEAPADLEKVPKAILDALR